jgi:hypothetical protein
MAEIVQRLPGNALISRRDDFAIRVRAIQRAVAEAGALIQVVNVGGGGVERVGGGVFHQAIHSVGVMAGVAEGPGHTAVCAADSFDIRITSKQV